MSDLIVEVSTIDKVGAHPNAERLDIAMVKGWSCVTGKDRYKEGDKVLYIPIDSILPQDLEDKLFPPDSKIKLRGHRIKTIKIRGAISQGLLVAPEEVGLDPNIKVGTDVTSKLGITKFEPEEPHFGFKGGNQKKKILLHEDFMKYTNVQNIKNFPNVFQPGDHVIVTEKIHGTNFRCGWVKFKAYDWKRKLLKFFRRAPVWEFVYGSHNMELSESSKNNVYWEAVEKYDLKKKIPHGVVIYGEIYGASIQKGYRYGCAEGERKLVIFDVRKYGEYQGFDQVQVLCDQIGVDTVPVIDICKFEGTLKDDENTVTKFVGGPSILCPEQKVREGVVIRSLLEEISPYGRKLLKAINPEYLLKDQTEFH